MRDGGGLSDQGTRRSRDEVSIDEGLLAGYRLARSVEPYPAFERARAWMRQLCGFLLRYTPHRGRSVSGKGLKAVA